MISNKKDCQEIAKTCLRLLNKEVDFIEGCRSVLSLRNQLGLEADPTFLPFVSVVSETDDYPSLAAREYFSERYLNKIDREVSEYILQVQPSIFEVCKELFAKYGS